MQIASTHGQIGQAINDEKDTKTGTTTSDQVKEIQEITNYAEGQNEINNSRGDCTFYWGAKAEGYI